MVLGLPRPRAGLDDFTASPAATPAREGLNLNLIQVDEMRKANESPVIAIKSGGLAAELALT